MPTYADTVPVMERHRFDAASLDRYFTRHLDSYRGELESVKTSRSARERAELAWSLVS
jgi:hypothetical protein